MFKKFIETRHQILFAILVLYFLPLIFLSGYSAHYTFAGQSWRIWALGFLFAILGSLILFLIMRDWENHFLKNEDEVSESLIEPTGSESSLESIDNTILTNALEERQTIETELDEAKNKEKLFAAELLEKKNEILNLAKEKEKLQKQTDQSLRELNQFKEACEEKLEQNQIFLGEYQQTINEQRVVIEAKQHLVEQLENKVRDLTYEIKTLLQLAEKVQIYETQEQFSRDPEPHFLRNRPLNQQITKDEESPDNYLLLDKQTSTPQEAAQQLKRCIDIAQKITGASHYGSRSAKMRDISFDNFALDYRRLFDILHSEPGGTILVYSQKENKLLFVNNRIKNLLGWNCEKFIQNFSEIISTGRVGWETALSQLAYKNECSVKLLMKKKGGQETDINCHLGIIPTGVFRSNIIGIIY